TRPPDGPRPSSRTTVSSRLSFPEFPLPLPFPSPSQRGFLLLAGELRSHVLALCVVPTGLAFHCGPRSKREGWSPEPRAQSLLMFLPERLDPHIHARGQIELHQCIHCLLGGLEDNEQALVRPDLESLAGLLVHVRRPQHAVLVLHRGQRNRPCDLRAGAPRGFDNFT